jgi:hypothetical protein
MNSIYYTIGYIIVYLYCIYILNIFEEGNQELEKRLVREELI